MIPASERGTGWILSLHSPADPPFRHRYSVSAAVAVLLRYTFPSSPSQECSEIIQGLAREVCINVRDKFSLEMNVSANPAEVSKKWSVESLTLRLQRFNYHQWFNDLFKCIFFTGILLARSAIFFWWSVEEESFWTFHPISRSIPEQQNVQV